MRCAESAAAATARLALSDDGTLLSFAAFADGSAATPDETYILNRAPAALNYSNQLMIGYLHLDLPGWQRGARGLRPG